MAEAITTPRPSRMPHRSIILAGIATALSLMGDQAMYVVLPLAYQGLLSETLWTVQLPWGTWAPTLSPMMQVGILLSANRWIRLLTNHVAEWLVHHFHPSLLFVGMLLFGALTTAVYGTWSFFALLLVARVGWGLCWSIVRQVGIMTAVDAGRQEAMASVMGTYNGLSRIGSVVGMLVGGALFDHTGFRWCFWILALMTLVGVFPAGLARRGLSHHESSFRKNREITLGKRPFSLLACGFIVGCGLAVVSSTTAKVLRDILGDEVQLFGMVLGIGTVAALVLSLRYALGPLLGRLADRIGHDRGMAVFFTIGLVVLAASVVSAWLSAYVAGMVMLIVLLVLFFACATLLSVVLSAQAGLSGSKTFAWYVTAEDCGAATGPLLGWTVFVWYDHPTVPYALGTALFAVGAAVAMSRLVARRKQTEKL